MYIPIAEHEYATEEMDKQQGNDVTYDQQINKFTKNKDNANANSTTACNKEKRYHSHQLYCLKDYRLCSFYQEILSYALAQHHYLNSILGQPKIKRK